MHLPDMTAYFQSTVVGKVLILPRVSAPANASATTRDFSKFSFAPTRQGRGIAAAPQTPSSPGFRSDGYRHRQAEILRGGASRNWLLGFARARNARQQPRGELASAGSTTRTKDARLQISEICSALRFGPCGRLQHVQCSTAFDEPSDASTVSKG
jgi:hypothetical protein